ncbi:GNAT family N-acetyltransferase [Sphingomonas sp. CL5.1]|uniref:GNAT family N-acetyltransferase n=1 Tax=Sphingomonas sp. CL5.1 TaxID=2653203 RepID=UPI0015814245|nr:GNAT family N-acetyltransferase [Sphingomonas sp. CL5.1]QKS01643.1 GNAT family N-acetyltransferase [Sphingomonas sp. CL5.1]
MIANSTQLRQITSLHDGILPLSAEAEGEGHRFMRRLQDEWNSGTNRFAGHGECLLGAYVDGHIVAIGGLNKDPYIPAATVGRLRHVYVSSSARRQRIGTILVKHIADKASRTFTTLRLRTTTTEAAAFYERLGFRRTDEEAATHVLDLRA